jgi:hypothetical protein
MITKTDSGSTVITGSHIELYRLLALRKGLELEIRTGIKMFRGSVLMAISSITGQTYRGKGAKARALADITAVIDSVTGE